MDAKTREEFFGELNLWWKSKQDEMAEEWQARRLQMREEMQKDIVALFTQMMSSGEGNPIFDQVALMRRQAEALESIKTSLQDLVNFRFPGRREHHLAPAPKGR